MNATAQVHTLTLPWVEAATSKFVNACEMREAFSLAMAAGLNLIFSGPGGHAKSDFLMSAIGAIENQTPYVKSFGQGTSPEELYGGIDFDALNRQEQAVIQYNPELSFLAHEVAVFEELFDAPSRVLTSLKDTLTARELRNGHQRYKMVTRVIAAATNHSPQTIAEGGPEIAALVERFPIQLEVKWPNYSESSFVELFATVTSDADSFEQITWNDVANLQEQARSAVLSPLVQRILAKVIVELLRDNVTISPRTAVLAMQLARAAAAINGRSQVIARDLIAIAFLPGAHELKSRIGELIEEFESRMADEMELERLEDVFNGACDFNADTKEDLESIIHIFDDIYNDVHNLDLSTELTALRDDLTLRIAGAGEQARKKLESIQFLGNIDEQQAELDVVAQEVKTLTDVLRHARTADRRDLTRRAIGKMATRLSGMQLHPSLEEARQALHTKIQLADVEWTKQKEDF